MSRPANRDELIAAMVSRMRDRYPWISMNEPAVMTPLLLVTLVAELIEVAFEELRVISSDPNTN